METNKAKINSSVVMTVLILMAILMIAGILRFLALSLIYDKSLSLLLFFLGGMLITIIIIKQLISLVVYLSSDVKNKKLIIKALILKNSYSYQDIKEIKILSPIIANNPAKIKIYFKNNSVKSYYFQSSSSNLDNIQLLLNILNISYSLRTAVLII